MKQEEFRDLLTEQLQTKQSYKTLVKLEEKLWNEVDLSENRFANMLEFLVLEILCEKYQKNLQSK